MKTRKHTTPTQLLRHTNTNTTTQKIHTRTLRTTLTKHPHNFSKLLKTTQTKSPHNYSKTTQTKHPLTLITQLLKYTQAKHPRKYSKATQTNHPHRKKNTHNPLSYSKTKTIKLQIDKTNNQMNSMVWNLLFCIFFFRKKYK